MITEPLFNLKIPDNIASVYKHYIGADEKAIKLVILAQVYTDVVAQAGIESICRWLSQAAGIRLIAVEGSDEQITTTSHQSIEELLRTTPNEVAAGVLHFMQDTGMSVTVRGVDEMELKKKSTDNMARLSSIQHTREKVFSYLRSQLKKIQNNVYPKELSTFQQGMLFRGIQEQMGLPEQIGLLQKLATTTEVDLSMFPALDSSRLIIGLEKSFNRVTLQGEILIFLKRIQKHATGWYKISGNRVTINLKKFVPFLAFYANSVGMSQRELELKIQDQDSRSHLIEDCQVWLKTKLTMATTQLSSHSQQNAIFEDLMCMALQTDIPYFDLKQLRRYVTAERLKGELRAQGDLEIVAEQIQACIRRIINAYKSPNIKQLFSIEIRLDEINRAIRLEMDSQEAEYTDIGEGAFHNALTELAKLDKTIIDLQSFNNEITVIDNALEQSCQFTERSRLRGKHMLQRTIELIQQLHEDRAILVTGGFHARQIAQALEDSYPDVSWIILIPQVDTNNVHILSNN